MRSLSPAVVVLCIAILACETRDRTSTIEQGLDEWYPGSIKELHAVLYLKEQGCIACNRAFAMLMQEYLGEPNVAMIIHGTGSQVDISPFLEKAVNVSFDFDGAIGTMIGIDASSGVLLRDGHIDTMIVLDARMLHEQLALIRTHLLSD